MKTSEFIANSLKVIHSSPVESLGKILQYISEVAGCEYGVILTLDEVNNKLVLDVIHGYPQQDILEHRGERLRLDLDPGKSVSADALLEARRKGESVPIIRDGSAPDNLRITETKVKKSLGYAIEDKGEFSAVLTLESLTEGVLERLEPELLEVFSNVIWTALAGRQSLVFSFDEFIERKEFKDFESFSQEVMRWVYTKFNVNSCAIYFIKYDETTGEHYYSCMDAIIDREAETDLTGVRFMEGEGYAGWVAANRASLILTDFENEESEELKYFEKRYEDRPKLKKKLCQRRRSLKFKSYLGVPITDGKRVYGVLEVLDTERKYAFSDEGLLEIIARRIAAEYKRIQDIKRERLFDIPNIETRNWQLVVDGVVTAAMNVAAATHGFFMKREPDGSFTARAVKGYNLRESDIPPIRPGQPSLINFVMETHSQFVCQNINTERENLTPEKQAHLEASLAPQGFINPVRIKGLLMVPVYLKNQKLKDPHTNASPEEWEYEDLGVLVLMSSLPNSFQQDELVITAMAEIVSYHIWGNAVIAELEDRRVQVSQLQQAHSRAAAAAGASASAVHTVKRHVEDVTKAIETLNSLEKVQGDKTLRELARQIRKPFEELRELYERLFDIFSGSPPALEVCDMAKLVQEVREYMEPTFRGRRISFRNQLKDDHLPEVKADPLLMKVVFTNLIRNSIDANAREITVSGRKTTGYLDRPVVELTFKDDGIGIPNEDWEKVFKLFTTAHKKGGTGIGLALNREILDKHRGDIKVIWSEVGEGTVISLTLPIK